MARSLFAALNTKTGEVLGQTVARHTSAAFVEFLGAIVDSQPRAPEIHVILDNLATHKTRAVTAFLESHPQTSTSRRRTRRGSIRSSSVWPHRA